MLAIYFQNVVKQKLQKEDLYKTLVSHKNCTDLLYNHPCSGKSRLL